MCKLQGGIPRDSASGANGNNFPSENIKTSLKRFQSIGFCA